MSFHHSIIFQNNEVNNPNGKAWTTPQIPTEMVLEKCCTNKPIPTTSQCKEKSKVPGTSKMKFECLDCEVFKRKIKENEQSVSSRDILIEMLQSEIQKTQNLYKNSIDDYEKLRFIHCSTVHDFSSLKEIHRKIEAENRRLLDERTSLLAQLHTLEALQHQLGRCKKEFQKWTAKRIG